MITKESQFLKRRKKVFSTEEMVRVFSASNDDVKYTDHEPPKQVQMNAFPFSIYDTFHWTIYEQTDCRSMTVTMANAL